MMNETNRMRTSDREREETATILRAAMSEGRLQLAEGEERLAAAYAATFRDELAPLTADLPFGGRRALAETPQARAAARRALRTHLLLAVAASLVLTGLWVLSGAHFFWPIIPMIILFVGVRRHARWGRFRREYWYAHHGGPWQAPHPGR